MPRIAFRTFDKGLWLAGGRDSGPEGTLRRANGIAQIREGAIRSARGSREIDVSLTGANRFIRFQDALFRGAGADVFRETTAINTGFPQVPAPRVSFLRMPPQPELVDWLFIAGGGNPFKVQADGSTPSKWGIDAPPDQAVAMLNAPSRVSIDTCDATTGWTNVDSFGVAVATDSVNFVEGTASLKWAFEEGNTNRYRKTLGGGPGLNLDTFLAAKSADQDYIQLWIRLTGVGNASDHPSAAENLDWIEVAFALGTTDFHNNVLTRRIDAVDGVIPLAGLADQAVGVATALQSGSGIQTILEQAFISQTEQDIVDGKGVFNEASDTRRLLDALSQTQIMRQNDVWQRLLLPKSSFDRTGSNGALGWADVQAIRLTFKRSGNITILVDDIAMVGGTGMVGKYQYLFTYKNSVTGSRSNANPTPLVGVNLGRQSVTLGNLPQPTDPQVDTVEVWRTVGNGEAFFHAIDVPVGTLSVVDNVSDFAGLFTNLHLMVGDFPPILDALELPLDNDPPPATIREVLSHPHLGRAWFLDSADGQQGRLFYSPVGRPESLGAFVDVTQTDDVLQRVVRWNDVLYVLSTHGLFRIVGTEEPFTAQEVFGALGTIAFDTVVVTPFGIVYRAPDGVRLFDGTQSQRLAFDPIAPIQRGYDAEDAAAFAGITAAYFREDYVISDGLTQTLACDLRDQTWRRFALGLDTLYAADDDNELLAAVNNDIPAFAGGRVFQLEDEAADIPTAFEIQTPSKRTAIDVEGIVQRVLIELESPVTLVPTLLYDTSEVTLPGIGPMSRSTLEYARLDRSRLIGVRLTGEVLDPPIIVYGIEVYVYVPEEGAT